MVMLLRSLRSSANWSTRLPTANIGWVTDHSAPPPIQPPITPTVSRASSLVACAASVAVEIGVTRASPSNSLCIVGILIGRSPSSTGAGALRFQRVILGHGHPQQGHPTRQRGGDTTPDRPCNDLATRHCVTAHHFVENRIEVAAIQWSADLPIDDRIELGEIDDHSGLWIDRTGDCDRHPVKMSVTRCLCTPAESSLRLGGAPALAMHPVPGVEREPASERDSWLGQNATPIPIVSADATTYCPERPVGFTACGSSAVPGSASGSSDHVEGYFSFQVNAR